jgi:hypothetical protein
MRKMKYVKLFESYGSSPAAQLVDNLEFSDVEEYFNEHLGYDDFEEIISVWPSLVWNNIDDDAAMGSIIEGEINNLSNIEEWDEEDIRDYLKYKNINEDELEGVYKTHIENEVDLEELSEYKSELKNTEDKEEKKVLRKNIRVITKRIKEIKKMDLDDLLDEMSRDSIYEVMNEIFDVGTFVETAVNNRYAGYDLVDYIEDIWGSTDSITFDSYNNKGDWDWVLKYVDEDAVIKACSDNESYEYKEERVKEELYRALELQEKLLEIDPKNSLLLFELFVGEYDDDQISDTYNFQKAYIESYAHDDEDEEGEYAIAKAVKNLYDEFGLNDSIKDEYSDHMVYVTSDKFNL